MQPRVGQVSLRFRADRVQHAHARIAREPGEPRPAAPTCRCRLAAEISAPPPSDTISIMVWRRPISASRPMSRKCGVPKTLSKPDLITAIIMIANAEIPLNVP